MTRIVPEAPSSEMMESHFQALLSGPPHRLSTSGNRLNWDRTNVDAVIGAVYAFWWMDELDNLVSSITNSLLPVHGPNRAEYLLDIVPLLHEALPGAVPLYVGKTSIPLTRRVGQHLMLGSPRSVAVEQVCVGGTRKRTSNQLRDRLDRLFSEVLDTRSLILKHIRLTYVSLPGTENLATRFYLEDYCVGRLRPPFNVDSER